jgi:hypothetical protein
VQSTYKQDKSRTGTVFNRFFSPTTLVGGIFSLSLFCGITPAFAVPVTTSDQPWVAGAFLSPPSGAATGRLDAWRVGTDTTQNVQFAKPKTLAGNSFFVAYDVERHVIYVPTLAGRTDILDSHTFASKGDFTSIQGGHVAAVSPDHKVLLILSGKETAAYSIPKHSQLFVLPVGGNAITFNPDGNHAYIGGNANANLTEIDVSSGKVGRTLPVAHTGDMVWADGKLFSANMKSGIMSVLDPVSGSVTRIKTPEVDPNFSYMAIPKAAAGFMQLAVDQKHHKVYAAGFSGNILMFSSGDQPSYLGEIAVRENPHANVNKLSGLSIISDGKEALVTVENLKATVVVRLSDGSIVRKLPGIASNRWVTLGQN